jgi:hypothetical protein
MCVGVIGDEMIVRLAPALIFFWEAVCRFFSGVLGGLESLSIV